MLGSKGGEKRNAYAALEHAMRSEGINWSDIGNWIEQSEIDEGKYTEADLQGFGQAMRAEGVETGIKIGMARAGNGGANGHFVLPKDSEMADYCRSHRDDLEPKHHSFVDKMPTRARSWRPLSLKEKGYLVSLYIKHGGKT